jgi:hypothetical protein
MGGLVRIITKKEPPRQVVQEEIQAKKTEPKKLARKRLPSSRRSRTTGMMTNYAAELSAESTRNPLKRKLGVA